MKSTFFSLSFSILWILLLSSCSIKEDSIKADFIIKNAVVWTANEQQPLAEAMAISGDTILAIGTNASIENYIGAKSKVLDINGQFITPGFIDAHVHFITGGFNLSSVQLRDADTPGEFFRAH